MINDGFYVLIEPHKLNSECPLEKRRTMKSSLSLFEVSLFDLALEQSN